MSNLSLVVLPFVLVLALASAAETAASPAAVGLPAPDLAKPVWVIVQCDKTAPPQMTAEQKKAAA